MNSFKNMPGTRAPKMKRLISLDALRGFTIAAMVIVNDPGSWNHVYRPLRHAPWNGCTITDLIFPFFLFIVGVSITLAYSKRMDAGVPKKGLYKKILIRSFNIYALGIFLWLYPEFNFSEIRWVGVLPRISFVFLACARRVAERVNELHQHQPADDGADGETAQVEH